MTTIDTTRAVQEFANHFALALANLANEELAAFADWALTSDRAPEEFRGWLRDVLYGELQRRQGNNSAAFPERKANRLSDEAIAAHLDGAVALLVQVQTERQFDFARIVLVLWASEASTSLKLRTLAGRN